MNQFGPSFIYETDGLTFNSRIIWYAEEFMVESVTARSPEPVATKQIQIITPTHTASAFALVFAK